MELLGDTFVPPGLTGVTALHCPRCIWPYLQTVRTPDEPHLLCQSCGHCWYLDRGRLRPVNVLACHGCTARSKSDCIRLLHDEFPRFGAYADAAT